MITTIKVCCFNSVRRYKVFVWKAMRDGKQQPNYAFDYWQSNLFVFIITWIMPVGILIALPVSIYELQKGDISAVAINAFTLFAINIIVLQRSISLFYRKLLFALVLVVFSLLVAICLHNLVLGCMYLFTASIFMVLFFSGKTSYTGVTLNAVVFLLFTVYLLYNPHSSFTYNITLYQWIVFSINFLFIDIVVVLLIRVLLTGIRRSLTAQKELNRRLVAEAMLKREQHRRLREIAFVQSHLVRAPLLNIKGISSLIIHSNNHNIDKILLSSLEQSVEELDGVIKSVVERTSV